LKLVNEDPDSRPTAFQLLSSDSIPSAVLSRELLVSLSGSSQSQIRLNHKNYENIKLMHFLFSRQTPRDLELSYDGAMLERAFLSD